jgi:nucleotide-binding universal stress UspA family protein
MTPTQMLGIAGILWGAIGVAAALVMGRRGHSAFTWLLIGAILGPLVIPIAVGNVRTASRDPRARSRPLREGVVASGTVDVLAGIDGSTEAEAALRAALKLFGNGIARLTLAGVLDYDSAISGRPWGTEQLAVEALEGSAAEAGSHNPGTVLLAGQPAEALMKQAAEEGYEVLVVGRRGHGASKSLLGSTATRLAQGAETPVLIV